LSSLTATTHPFLFHENCQRILSFSSWLLIFFVLSKTEHMKPPHEKNHPRFFYPRLNILCFCDCWWKRCGRFAVITSTSRQAQTITEVSMDCVGEKVNSHPRCVEMLKSRQVLFTCQHKCYFASFSPFILLLLFFYSTYCIYHINHKNAISKALEGPLVALI